LTEAGKFPIVLDDENDSLAEKVESTKAIKFQMQKVLCMFLTIGNNPWPLATRQLTSW
jgi:hypothetical protein